MAKQVHVKEKDMKVLRAIAKLQPNAYAVTVFDETGFSLGFIYEAAERLSAHFIASRDEPGGVERGFRRKVFWDLTDEGRLLLEEQREDQ